MNFIEGSTYTRNDVHELYHGTPVPRIGTGNWTSGYVRVDDEMIFFLNIGVPGRTGHDFDNAYNERTRTAEIFGKPGSHSKQLIIAKVITGEYTSHIFARWDNSNPSFRYLGVGEVVSYVDGNPTITANGRATETIKLTVAIKEEPRNQTTEYSDFGDAPPDDPDELQNFAKRVRRGQREFRGNMLRAYGNKCSITGDGPQEVLEAAHILPHAKTGNNELDNGLLLRADLHHLFDDDLLKIDPTSRTIFLDTRLENTSYWVLNGVQLRPMVDGSQISPKYLELRWAAITS